MVVYAKTYENVKTIGKNFPVEDQFFYEDNMAIVADGITRDPKENMEGMTHEDLIDIYPEVSGAEIASKTICESFKDNANDNLTLKEMLIRANERVKKVNDKYIGVTDYLVNDLYGSVAAAVKVKDNIMYYAYICDCGVVVFNSDGNIKFQTVDDMSKIAPHFDMQGFKWYQPEGRVIIRRDFRNKPQNMCSYGAITGEEEAIPFIREGQINIEASDIIIVYSDGFDKYFKIGDFFKQIEEFDADNFDKYVEKLGLEDYSQYGHERTIIMLKNK